MTDRTYTVEITNTATKQIRRLDRTIQRIVMEAILDLANDPRPVGCTPLKGQYAGFFRIHVAKDYRVVYSITDSALTVEVVRVGGRGDVY